MGMFIFFIGFLTMVVSGIFFILGLIKKKPLRNKIVIFMGGFLLLIGGALLTPAATPELHVDEAELVTNEQGEAAITGQTNPEAQLTINGVEVSLADETFFTPCNLKMKRNRNLLSKPQWVEAPKKKSSPSNLLAHF